MTFLASVVRAEYQGGYRIRLTFNDLSRGTVDFRPWLDGPVFEALRDPQYFRKFFVDGGTVVWPNGADIAPETLYNTARERTLAKRPQPALRSRSSARRATRE